MIPSKLLIAATCIISLLGFYGCHIRSNNNRMQSIGDSITRVYITISTKPIIVDKLIYGQMLEVCNDSIIYGGIVNHNGSERPQVNNLLKPLEIPIVRWPGGTYSLEYHWENGIGPKTRRPIVQNHAWGGTDNNYFGTDEFMKWCNEINTTPYINLNMGNRTPFAGTLQEALNWIEYVNGAPSTTFGKKRVYNGCIAPYNVMFWGIGNENYLTEGEHIKESDSTYSQKLFIWANAIRGRYPDLKLLAVGHTYNWDKVVLEKCGALIDFLTQHYYVTSKFKNGRVQNPENSLFAPIKVEAHLKYLSGLIDTINQKLGRFRNPIRLAIDEWDNRHSVDTDSGYIFTRQDPRRQFDAAVVAGMLNVFIRQSPTVGMANYLFPVNGHGLVRTIGDTGAYVSSIYYIFQQYRKWMVGEKLNSKVKGSGILSSSLNLNLDGDANEIRLDSQSLSYIDAASVLTHDKMINVSLINRSSAKEERVKLILPPNYTVKEIWELANMDINSSNTANDRRNVEPAIVKLDNSNSDNNLIIIPPCGVYLIQCTTAK